MSLTHAFTLTYPGIFFSAVGFVVDIHIHEY